MKVKCGWKDSWVVAILAGCALFGGSALAEQPPAAPAPSAPEAKPVEKAAPTAPAPAAAISPGERDPKGYFKTADTNGDGKVSKEELDAFMPTVFAKADADHDGSLSPREFGRMFAGVLADRRTAAGPDALAAARKRGAGKLPEGAERGRKPSAQQMIERVDANHDGKIEKDEAPERMKRDFDTHDANHDGALDAAEFQKMLDEGMRGTRTKPPAGHTPPTN